MSPATLLDSRFRPSGPTVREILDKLGRPQREVEVTMYDNETAEHLRTMGAIDALCGLAEALHELEQEVGLPLTYGAMQHAIRLAVQELRSDLAA
jgi:hypothetical protein